ncbi:MuDRA-like transposase [Cucumis melo var. makuwa]|uniref:MuDRA-like transposase n=1 Tax=Cucumis melo var. makuwa TaxID=1194695 RepID=A0A5A7UBS6_CUCMM|nr:MuDRA-like transposase [Cucumis melo var. makuwa]TYK29207.1 MuDRA-like transposase [Cucumis melo var. makuwa]
MLELQSQPTAEGSQHSLRMRYAIRGFLNCIRPVIVMDGTFLKNKYWGQLIVSVCLDGNNQIYPLTFGVVDRETDDSIQWFLEKLKGAIGLVPSLGFVTDQKTCFSKGISSVFPSAFHGLCVQHLTQNFHDKYKNDTVATLFYNASRTYCESKFLEAWRNILAFPNGSRKYLNDVGIARWSRVHCPGRRYNMMTTNIAESMNSILKEPRDLPIASFLEHVRALLQPYAETVYPVGNSSDWKTSEDYVRDVREINHEGLRDLLNMQRITLNGLGGVLI